MRKMKNLLALTITITSLTLYACPTAHRDNGWYTVDNSNNIEGEAIVTTNDFAKVSLDTVTDPEIAFIQGVLKQDRISDWADATERRIGKRVGFVYKDSVIMAPTVNCRIESGSFSINNSDKRLILEIYNSLDCDKIEPPYVMPQKSYATASATYRLVKTFSYPPYPIHKSDTAYVEFQIR